MPTKEMHELGTIYLLNKNTGEYVAACAKFGDAISEVKLEEPEQDVVMGFDLSSDRDFTATFTLKPPVVVDAEYKEITE